MQKHESFGRWLKHQRTIQSLTQTDLAHLVGCAVVTLRKIEADLLRPSQHMASRFVDVLGVSAYERPALLAVARGEQPTHYHQLPTPLTSLIGRSTEIAAACVLLRSGTRLLTLAGPGGIGKTRLAIQIATALLDDFASGVCFVDLALIRDPNLVLPTIAKALNVREQPDRPLLDLLTQELCDQHVLLVLDNFEQILPSAPQIAALLKAVPGLLALITSRSILRLSGEYVFIVPPLDLPPTSDQRHSNPQSADRLVAYSAIALFVARTQAVAPGFALTAANAPIVAAICTRLDGLPLAIELAATRSRIFTPAALLARLERRLEGLAHGAQNMPERQQTLRATISWSYELLGANERMLLQRLAVFRGGCTLDAAEAIVDVESSARAAGTTLLDLLAALLDHSMIYQQLDADGTPRFGMLETIHEYALEQLVASGDLAMLQAHHSAYYLAFAEAAETQLDGADQAIWLQRLELEHDNLRATLTWNLSGAGDPMIALKLAGALGQFWQLRSYLSQGQTWLAAALAAASPAATLARAKALQSAGWLMRYMNNQIQAEALIEQSLAMYRSLGDIPGIAHALYYLGDISVDRSDYHQAQARYDESLTLAHAIGEMSLKAWGLQNLGYVARWDMDYAQAERFFTEGLLLFRQVGAVRGIATALWNLARNAKEQCDYSRAAALAEESLALFHELGSKNTISIALFLLGEIAQCQGDDTRALALLDQAIDLVRNAHGARQISWVLTVKGLILELRGDLAAHDCYEESQRLFGQVGDPEGQAAVVFGLSRVALLRGDPQAAYQLLETYVTLRQDLQRPRETALSICLRDATLAAWDATQSIARQEQNLAQFRAAGDQWGECFALRMLGQTLIGVAADARAIECASAGLALASALDDRLGIAIQLMGLATVALRTGEIAQAAQLCGAIETMQASLGLGYVAASLWPPDRARYTRTSEAVRARLSNTALATAWAAGRARSTAAAITAALAFTSEAQAANN